MTTLDQLEALELKSRIGARVGRLVVKEFIGIGNSGQRMYSCLCDCGKLTTVRWSNLRAGHTSSCGCLKNEKIRTHGMTNTPEFAAWWRMKKRCLNESDNAYHHYGGRGIRVAEEWIDSFDEFYKHVGPRPSNKHSLGRINNDGNYEPGNVRWETGIQQHNNTRAVKLISINDETKSLADWCRHYGLDRKTVGARIRRGWSVEKALEICDEHK